MSCGSTPLRNKLKSHFINSKLINRFDEVLNYKETLQELNKLAESTNKLYNINEAVAVLLNNGTKIKFKEELLHLIDAKNDIFYPSNEYLRDESPFVKSFLGLTAIAKETEPLRVDYIKGDTGRYFVYKGKVYIALDYGEENGELVIKSYSPYEDKKFSSIPEEGIEYKGATAVLTMYNGDYHFLTPSNQAINLKTHRVLDADPIIKDIRRSIVDIEMLVPTEDVMLYYYNESSKNMSFEDYKNIFTSFVRNNSELTSEELQNKIKCF